MCSVVTNLILLENVKRNVVSSTKKHVCRQCNYFICFDQRAGHSYIICHHWLWYPSHCLPLDAHWVRSKDRPCVSHVRQGNGAVCYQIITYHPFIVFLTWIPHHGLPSTRLLGLCHLSLCEPLVFPPHCLKKQHFGLQRSLAYLADARYTITAL